MVASSPTLTTLDPLALSGLWGQVATGLVLLDADLCLCEANPAARALLGAGLYRPSGQPVSALCGDPRLAVSAARARDEAQAACLRGLKLGHGEAPVDVFVSPLSGIDARPVVLEMHALLPQAALEPDPALHTLAHELRNPLSGLRGAAQLLDRKLGEAQLKEYTRVIMDEADRLAALLDRRLGKPGEVLAPVNVHAVLEHVRVLAEGEGGPALVIERDYDPSLPEFPGHPGRLTQAVLNLVRNALQAGASRLRLRTRAEQGALIHGHKHRLAIRIEVHDDGRGVPDALAGSLFLPLVSGRPGGSGLGLAVAQEIAREHGGVVEFESRPGATVFIMRLPRESLHG
ncbi:MAG TPA: ATP-binding protein [Xanthomonadaceae bacterium]|nr:ATP-binding protein [Xanthomonadaceae bacterium]